MSEENPTLSELLEQEGMDRDKVRILLASVHPVDLAQDLDDLDLDERVRIFEMPDNAVADIIDHLPHHKEKQVLLQVDTNKQADIQHLRQYPPNTAGSRMTRNFVTVPATTTARQIIQEIQGAVDPHTVDFIYITDEHNRLQGISSLARLMLHKPDEKVGDFMRKEISVVGPNTDQEEVARLAQKYRIRAVPVVDAD